MTEETPADDGSSVTGETAWQTLAPLIDLVTPMAVRVAATLRLADLLRDGPVAATDLARRSGANAEALERMLRHLTYRGMFAETSAGVFALTPTAALLDSDHPGGMRVSLDLTGFGGQMDLAFTSLLHTVRTGEPAWQEVFGAPFWEFLEASPTMSASFDAVMSAGAEYVDDDVAAWDWSRARHVVDVGGGTGAFIAALLARHPELEATLVDLPATVKRGRELLAARGGDTHTGDAHGGETHGGDARSSDTRSGDAQNSSAHPLDSRSGDARVHFAGQSFFDPLPTAGDVYVLNSILHDWANSDAVAILRRCGEAAGPGGTIVVIEEHPGTGADHAEMDLRMLVLCGGRERTSPEFEALAGEAGLTLMATRLTPLGQIGIELRVDGAEPSVEGSRSSR